MSTNARKTPEEIKALKDDWHDDPCWDIEDTEGFEEHRDELVAYSNECKNKWHDAKKHQGRKRAKTTN